MVLDQTANIAIIFNDKNALFSHSSPGLLAQPSLRALHITFFLGHEISVGLSMSERS
jgi:hypothetical protein